MKFNKVTIIFSILVVLLASFALYTSLVVNKQLQQQKKETTKPYVTINGKSFAVDLAKSPAEQQHGLSDRDSLPQDSGMLFLFDQPQILSFWMKDMRFSIDIIFIKNDEIVSIAHNVPPPVSKNAKLPTYKSEKPADKVLEINAGLSKKYNIEKGDKIKINL